MFETASRMKLRFETNKGNITVEDLWDLPLTSRSKVSLDDIAKSLNKSIKENEEESFVVKKSDRNNILDLKFSIVKHIIKVRLEEAEKAELATLKRQQKAKILEIIESKKDQELHGKSLEELTAMVNELE